MLSIVGHATGSWGMCDRISRRRALHIGALGAFGLSLTDLLRAETAGLVHPGAKSRKSVILVWMHGGPSQVDTFDMKPDAPAEFRGPFQPIGTNVLGGLLTAHHLQQLHHVGGAEEMHAHHVLRTLGEGGSPAAVRCAGTGRVP